MNKAQTTLTSFLGSVLIVSCGFLTSCNHDLQKSSTADKVDQRVDSLMSLLSFDEKLGQMSQIPAAQTIDQVAELVKSGKIGSILNETDPVRINALQHLAVEQSKHHIPLMMARDVIHGYKTMFPIPIGQAATFDPSVAEAGARVAAVEASADGIRWTFSPMVDIARDARWGRLAEGYGEDVYLTSVMGAATVKGYQTSDLSNPSTMAACVKHFAGYGAVEGGRDYNSTFIPDRVLRNVYLPPFHAAVKAGALTLMTSFNDNNGIPSTGNDFLLKDILRKEWDFQGVVVTDWGTIPELVTHGFATDTISAMVDAVESGVDMDMASWVLINKRSKTLQNAGLTESDVDAAVRRILRAKFVLGLFDHPYVDTQKRSVKYAPSHLAVAQKAAIESVILLKNNGVLPLNKKVKRVLIVGPMADAPLEQLGTWTFDGEGDHTITPLKAFRDEYGKQITIDYMPVLAYSRDRNTSKIAAAAAAARRADVVLCFVGEEAILSGEAHTLADISLVGAQSQLVKSLSKTRTPLVTIVMTGRPNTIEKELNESDAMLYSFHPGTMGGPALAKLIMGDAVPSGKTPMTFPKMVGQEPIYYSHHNTGRPSNGHEQLLYDIPVHAGQTSTGCRSFYLDAGETPLFPFGYGLSYTTFAYSDLKVAQSSLPTDGTLKASIVLTNTGDREGTEVVQMYVRDLVGSVTRPVKELKRFRRVTLKPGEKKTVEFSLPIAELAFWTREMEHKVEPGEFNLWIAGDSNSGTPVLFTVTK